MIQNETTSRAPDRAPVLILEDDPFIAMDLEDIFTAHGFEVIGPFADADEGLKALDDITPNFAVLDYDLGQDKSVAVARALSQKDIPFVFLSGQMSSLKPALPDSVASAVAHPPVIAKPFTPQHLVHIAQTVLGSEQNPGSSVD